MKSDEYIRLIDIIRYNYGVLNYIWFFSSSHAIIDAVVSQHNIPGATVCAYCIIKFRYCNSVTMCNLLRLIIFTQ